MADLLGATNPVPGYDNTTINRNIALSPDNPQVQNAADPGRVSRPDNRTDQQDSGNLNNPSQIRYDSNFNTFIQRLRETPDLAGVMAQILGGREGIVVSSGMAEGIAGEMAQILEMLHMTPEELLKFLTDQFRGGSKFGGPLFTLLRGTYARSASANVRGDILNFAKCYLDNGSSAHIESNMLRALRNMADSMPASWGDKLRQLMAQLENSMAAGDRKGSLQLLQRQIFPYMSSYVERTHDMGTPRSMLTMLALDVARYENGSDENMLRAFRQLVSYGTLKEQLGGVDEEALLQLLRRSQTAGTQTEAARFADQLAQTAGRALRGEGSAQVQEAFRNLVSALLINESVYMPINHYMLPLEWDGKMIFSELWVDPDAEDSQNSGGKTGKSRKFLFKIDVQQVGLFDVVLTSRDKDVDLVIACPERTAPFAQQIQQAVNEILKQNGLTPAGVTVRKMERPLTLTEVFPRIFEGKNSINVKI